MTQELRHEGGPLASEDQIRTINTIAHHRIHVQRQLQKIIHLLEERALVHDESKYRADEFDGFARINRVAREHPYGSQEYGNSLKVEKGTLDLHYSRNRHHPESFMGPYDSPQLMGLIDLIEMVADWRAAWMVYEGQREESKRSLWSDNMAKQRVRFVDGKILSQEQWNVVEAVAALLER